MESLSIVCTNSTGLEKSEGRRRKEETNGDMAKLAFAQVKKDRIEVAFVSYASNP